VLIIAAPVYRRSPPHRNARAGSIIYLWASTVLKLLAGGTRAARCHRDVMPAGRPDNTPGRQLHINGCQRTGSRLITGAQLRRTGAGIQLIGGPMGFSDRRANMLAAKPVVLTITAENICRTTRGMRLPLRADRLTRPGCEGVEAGGRRQARQAIGGRLRSMARRNGRSRPAVDEPYSKSSSETGDNVSRKRSRPREAALGCIPKKIFLPRPQGIRPGNHDREIIGRGLEAGDCEVSNDRYAAD